MINDHYEAARLHVEKLLQAEEIDRAEVMEFVDIIYKAAKQMFPVYKQVNRTITDIMFRQHDEANGSKTIYSRPVQTKEEFIKALIEAWQETQPKLLSAPVPEGTMQAMDETLQNEAENLAVIEAGNPFKELHQWLETEDAQEKLSRLRDVIEAESKEQDVSKHQDV